MSGRTLLVRHPPVARAWDARCYGQSDMGWSRAGERLARDLLGDLVAARPALVVHSDLIRTRRLAERVARHADAPLVADPRWRERDFGAWEGQSWTAIWRRTGDLMDRMLTHPDSFRPGGGETTRELSDRVLAALRALPGDRVVVVVTHGGPIAMVLAARDKVSLAQSAARIPPCGAIVRP